MASPSARSTLSVLRDLNREDNRATIAATPQLAWALPELEAHERTLDDLIGRLPRGDADERAIRVGLAADDARHDDAHRFIYHSLSAARFRGDEAARRALGATLASLYPSGLSGIQVSAADEVDDGQRFLKRLEEPEIAAGLGHVRALTPAVDDAIADLRTTIGSMRERLAQLAGVEAKQKATPITRALFDARVRAVSTLSSFSAMVEHAFRGADPTGAERRERLLHAWRSALDRAARRPPTDGQDDLLLDDAPEDVEDATT